MSGDTTRHSLRLYPSAKHPCGYLESEEAVNWVVDPATPLDPARYGALLEHGLRRSGTYVYQPGCPRCSGCVPARVVLADFRPPRWARRTLRVNGDLRCEIAVNRVSEEVYDLYRRYQRWRHPESEMRTSDRAEVESFFYAPWQTTLSVAWRLAGRLVAYAVVDCTPGAFSCVYTLHDPAHRKRGLGTFAVLSILSLARQYDCRWLYLGYWVRDSPKMAYKGKFRPLETFENGRWRPHQD